MTESSLETTERSSAAVAVAPRVKLDDIKAAIAARYDLTGAQAGFAAEVATYAGDFEVPKIIEGLPFLSICILVMRNGFMVIGKSAPASPENYDRELGRTYAYEDAVRQLWPLMGYALRDKLAGS
jgi:hypothetical protein